MKMLKRSALGLGVALGLCGLGCASEDPSPQPSGAVDNGTPFERLQRLDSDLGPGSRGEGVRAVHDYLGAYGYFPNDGLAQRYPSWRPIVSSAPDDPEVWDHQTTEAVLALQSHTGLAATGIVDEPTRAILKSPRCGVPEGLTETDGAEKFAVGGTRWLHSPITWGLRTPDDVTIFQAENAFESAATTWSNSTTVFFNKLLVGSVLFADIIVAFHNQLQNVGALAEAAQPIDGGDITVNTDFTWSVATPTPAGQFDLQSVLLHELGHALGLRHSSFAGTVMFPNIASGTQARSLAVDDKVAISSIYDTWVQLPGEGRDIGVGIGVWKIGNSSIPGGYRIEKWNAGSSTWVAESANGGATRIAVECATDQPWVVNGGGQIFRRTASNPGVGAWEWKPGCATDIGVGCDGVGGQPGSVWSIGCDAVPGGFNIQKWNGSGWDQVFGGANRITVDSNGRPWITNPAGQIFRRTSNSAFSGSWEVLPGQARDIAIGPGNYAWIIGWDNTIHVWNEQAGIGTSAPARQWPCSGSVECARFLRLDGIASNIAVDGFGRPWVTNASLGTFMTWK
jgi:hypothetical protein